MGKYIAIVFLAGLACEASAAPFVPKDDAAVLAEVTPGTRHSELSTREVARQRIDVALPLAQLYIKRARSTGDLRFLGYAEAVLEPWVGPGTKSADALVLHATVLQSRHDFAGSLVALQRAREIRPDDPQAWLTSATVLRVLGQYEQAVSACEQLAARAESSISALCRESVRGLTGQLSEAYTAIMQINTAGMLPEERAWRDSELGEMAVRMGRDADAERWFTDGLKASPDDFYIRAAYADLLLRNRRAPEALELLKGRETLEPLLLRIAIAQKMLGAPGLAQSSDRLADAFSAEAQRGDGVHLREQARFLLDVRNDPRAALKAALDNWKVQHETDDMLVLVRAAYAAGEQQSAAPAVQFMREHGVEDARIGAVLAQRGSST